MNAITCDLSVMVNLWSFCYLFDLNFLLNDSQNLFQYYVIVLHLIDFFIDMLIALICIPLLNAYMHLLSCYDIFM